MKILYLGGKTAGLIGLLTLLSKGHEPVVVAYSEDVRMVGVKNRLAVFKSIPASYSPELIVSVHGREIVAKQFLDRTKYGGINLHPCLYGYKGKDPIRRALEAGETKFSVGAHRMTEKVDEGEVLVEKFIEVDSIKYFTQLEKIQDGVGEVYSHLYPLYSIVLSEALEKVCLK